MNHRLQGIPGSQTLPTETCLVLPRSEPSCMSQIIRCGGLSTKSLTLSEMTGPRSGKGPEMHRRHTTRERWEYRMVNKDAASHPFLASPLFFVCFVFYSTSSLFCGISEQQESTVWGKVKKLSKNSWNSLEQSYFSPGVFPLTLFVVNTVKNMP